MEEGISGISRDLLRNLKKFEEQVVRIMTPYDIVYQHKFELIKEINRIIDDYNRKIKLMFRSLETGINEISKNPITDGDRNKYKESIPKRKKQIEWLNQRKLILDEQIEQGIGQEIKEVLSFILELINELDPDDEVTTQKVNDFVSEQYPRVSLDYIRSILNSIAIDNEGYKFVRLKDAIRKIDRTSIEIDQFISQVEHPEKGKSGKD